MRVRIGVSEFNDKQYVDIRTYFEAEDGEWKPTKRGCTLDELKKAVARLEA